MKASNQIIAFLFFALIIGFIAIAALKGAKDSGNKYNKGKVEALQKADQAISGCEPDAEICPQ